jgi:hypothetical protein
MVAAKSQAGKLLDPFKANSLDIPSVTIPSVPSAPINSFVKSNPADDFLNGREKQAAISRRYGTHRTPLINPKSHLARCLVLMTSPSARTAV